ncbi:ankyrin repeat domain-containing protein [Spirosoma litoris]
MYRYYHIRGRFDVDVVDEDGYTALYHAVTPYGGSYDAVELLVEAGANLPPYE